MGKKISKKNVRVSKRKSCCGISTSRDDKNLNHLVKVLKPRVYITHPSDFKSLVHELTGNGFTIPPPIPVSSPSSISSNLSQPTDVQHIQLMPNDIIVDQDCCYGFQESSPKWSFGSSCSELIHVPLTTFDAWNISEVQDMSTQILSDDMIDQFHFSLFGSHEDVSLIQYGDELGYSWISEMHNPFVYNHEAPIMPLEVCEYTCDLSGLL